MGEQVSIQLFSNPRPVYFGAGIVAGLGLIPGFPKFSFLLLAVTLGFIGYVMSLAARDRSRTAMRDASAPKKKTE
jgi:flagellar biosynthesis component FlhA